MIPGKTYGLDDIIDITRRRKWLIVVPFVVATLATGALVKLLPNKYRAETVILVVPQRVPESYVRSTVTAPIEDRLRSISEQILSRSRLEQIITDLNLYPASRKTVIMEDIVARMRREIEVDVIKGDAFRVAYTGDDPKTVATVTQRLASLFIEENLKDREVLADGSYEFIDSQLDEARAQLLEHEKKVEEYSRKYDGQLPTQLQSNLQMMGNIQSQIRQIDESIGRDRDQHLLIERSIADATAVDAPEQPPAQADQAAGTLAQRLDAAREALRQLEMRLKPEHPEVVLMKRQIQQLAAQAEAAQMQTALQPADSPTLTAQQRAKENRLKELRSQIANLDKKIEGENSEELRLRDGMASYQARVEATPTRGTELTDLTRDYDTLQQTYRNLLFKKYDSRVAANLEKRQIGEQFKVLDPARPPEKPYSPDRFRLGLIGLTLGLCLGLGLAAAVEYTDTTLKTDEDVFAALSLPVLALVPLIDEHADQRKRRTRLRLATASTAALLLVATAFEVWKLRS